MQIDTMTTCDEAFLKAGQAPGLEIWRIEKLKVVLQPESTHGTFYSGDSYIVLNTKRANPNSNKLEWHIHFWLGKDSSQDERGVAAYKSVELDDSLGGAPVQHREVQEHESSLFTSYFKKGITYLAGGVESGFHKVERDKYETRLLHVKGKRNVRVCQVKCEASSLNKGDVFILDCGLIMFLWNGPQSSRMERIKGAEVAKRIKDEERGGRATICIIDESSPADAKFFHALGCDESPSIKSAAEGGDDKEFERDLQNTVTLYRVSDASGSLEIQEVASKPLKRDDLDSNDCFILDSGRGEIYVWIGKNCTKNEKKSAWQNAESFLTAKSYPEWTQITQLVEEGETPLFKQFFSSWPLPNAQKGLGRVYNTNRIAAYNKEKFDAACLHQKQSKPKKEFMPDDGTGKKEIWRVENLDLVPVPESLYGVFYAGDCYVVLYNYRAGYRQDHLLYFWQGSKSSVDEKTASAMFAKQLDDERLGRRATQIRVTQGQEPDHFLRLFQGKMTILFGGVNNVVKESAVDMFHIRGTNDVNTRAVQVLPRAASLNSNDVFVVKSDQNIFLWLGKGSSEEENRVARNVLTFLFPDRGTIEVAEEDESDEFWEILGGKEAYATGKRLQTSQTDMPTRLFHCSNASGRFRVEEIVDFSQEDLVEDDVMLLDTYEEVFVWIGQGANEIERKEVLFTAMEYIETDASGRSAENTPILQVKQGNEPPNFTGYFHAWDPDRWSEGKSYEDMKRELGQENVAATRVQEELACYDQTHTYEELTRRLPPKGVDVTNKEKYLCDEEFKKIFKISKQEYLSKPKWKQLQLKKRAGLF